MKVIEDELLIQFDDDQEFTDWALKPIYEVITSESGTACYDIPYTSMYLNAVEKGYDFEILQPNSVVTKRKAVSRGIITKPVQNLI